MLGILDDLAPSEPLVILEQCALQHLIKITHAVVSNALKKVYIFLLSGIKNRESKLMMSLTSLVGRKRAGGLFAFKTNTSYLRFLYN